MTTRHIGLATLALLAGCTQQPAGGNSAATPDTAQAARPASRWNALDACATLGNAAAAEASGSAVISSALSSVVQGSAATAAFSTCTYQLANGGALMVLTRESPVADATTGTIEAARISGGLAPAAADVPGLGKAALWGEQMKTLQLFLDDTRYASITYMGLPAGTGARPLAVAVARKLL